ncbi:MAG: phage/plasmid primase, P4 family, partial [Gemmatimonadota bacterium]|nr:phage/plasmid primase, P4 family [Gemmatimonadota bacterium]
KLDYWKDLILSWTGNEPAADCLQMVIGLALFGWATRHKIVLFMEGRTNTGKTTFAEAVKAAFGDYGIAADETFAANNPREKHLRQGSLHGKRLALIPDLGPGQKLDASMLKTVSGGDSLTGRKLNHDPFDFQPQCLILGASNDLPAPDKTDAALKDRLKVIPFERQFTKGQDMIPGLRTTLKTEYLGTIIEWARQGMESYLKNGQTFVWPDGVIARTSEFYQRIDPFEAWLATVHTEAGNAELHATTRELFDHYNEYREAESLKPLKHQQGFGRKLTDRGFPMKQMRVPGRTGKKFRVGVSLYPVPTVPTNEIGKQYEISDNIGSSTTTENNKRSIQKKAGGYSGYKPDKCAGCGGQIMYDDGVQVEGQMYCSVECVKSPF